MVIYESPQMSETLEEVEGITMNEREQIVQRLSDVTLGGGSHESLSALAKAILPGVKCWTYNDCDHLRRYLVDLISMNDGEYARGFDEGFASADDWLADNEAALEDHGYYRWPYKPGDDVEHDDGRRGVVKRVCLIKHEDGTTIKNILVEFDETGYSLWIKDSSLHQRHKSTVEDVLREFFSRYVTTKPKDEDDAIIAEFAAKLRLAEESAS